MGKALANKYRPKTFDDVTEQGVIKDILYNQLKNRDFKNGYLFNGGAGTGKTTTARIYANELNEGKGNPIELDAASNNSVEDIRRIIEDAQYQSLEAEYKVYILDECFQKDTKVQTIEGAKRISDIKINDKVLTLTGYQRVLHTFENTVDVNDLIILTINGEQTIVTKDHLYFTNRGWVPACQLNTNDILIDDMRFRPLTRDVVFMNRKEFYILYSQICSYYHTIGNEISINDLYNIVNQSTYDDYISIYTNVKDYLTQKLTNVNTEHNRFIYTYKDLLNIICNLNEVDLNNIYTKFKSIMDNNIILGIVNLTKQFLGNDWAIVTDKDIYMYILLSYMYHKHLTTTLIKLYNKYDGYVNNPTEFHSWLLSNKLTNDVVTYIDNNNSDSVIKAKIEIRSMPDLFTLDGNNWQEYMIEQCMIDKFMTTYYDKINIKHIDSVISYYDDRNMFKQYFDIKDLESGFVKMYDLEVEQSSTYFANGILVHNCHMLSTAAFNALLKILEEPPKKSIFILCTTDPQKIPNTILSRVQRYNFQRISQEGIINRLKYIIEQENKEYESRNQQLITYDEQSIEYIAKQADGGMRDAITLLDKCISYNNDLTLVNVVNSLGSVNYDTMFELTDALLYMNKAKMIEIIENIHTSGLDLKQFIKQYNAFVLDLCKYGILGNFTYLQLPAIYENKMSSYTDDDYIFFNQLLNEVIRLNNNIKWEGTPKPVIESTFLLLCTEVN